MLSWVACLWRCCCMAAQVMAVASNISNVVRVSPHMSAEAKDLFTDICRDVVQVGLQAALCALLACKHQCPSNAGSHSRY